MEENKKCCCGDTLVLTLAAWLLRFWLATRVIGTGLTKFQGKAKVIKAEYAGDSDEDLAVLGDQAYDVVDKLGIQFYHGLPEKGPMTIQTFSDSPLMPSFMVGPYAAVLGVALIGLGLTVLLGLFSRVSLFLMGLLYISLTYGFIILEPSMGPSAAAGIAYLGVHVIMIVMALALSKYNKFELFNDCKLCGMLCKKD